MAGDGGSGDDRIAEQLRALTERMSALEERFAMIVEQLYKTARRDEREKLGYAEPDAPDPGMSRAERKRSWWVVPPVVAAAVVWRWVRRNPVSTLAGAGAATLFALAVWIAVAGPGVDDGEGMPEPTAPATSPPWRPRRSHGGFVVPTTPSHARSSSATSSAGQATRLPTTYTAAPHTAANPDRAIPTAAPQPSFPPPTATATAEPSQTHPPEHGTLPPTGPPGSGGEVTPTLEPPPTLTPSIGDRDHRQHCLIGAHVDRLLSLCVARH